MNLRVAFSGLLFLAVFCASVCHSQPLHGIAPPSDIIRQEIIYHTTKAKEVILVWAVGNWEVPASESVPLDSYIKKSMVYTPMMMSGDSFRVSLPLKTGTVLHYMFWLVRDEKGNPSVNWDTFYGANYSLLVKRGSEARKITSIYDSPNIWSFNLLNRAWAIGIGGTFILSISLFFYSRQLKSVSPFARISGFLLASFIIMLLARFQMNQLDDAPYLLFGAGYHDLVFLWVFGITGAMVLWLIKSRKLRNATAVLLVFFTLLLTGVAICNIEIVKQIGRPLNYQWLYYSGFLQSADAKNAIDKNFSLTTIQDITLILWGFATAGLSFGLFFHANGFVKKAKWALPLVLFAFGLTGFLQQSDARLNARNTENPIVSFVSSWLAADRAPRLYSMDISESDMDYVAGLHTQSTASRTELFPAIKHIVLFVLESTPAEYISIYNKQYRVTPSIEKWQPHSRIFENMYAHKPSTHSTLFSLVSGIYPPITYRAVVEERPDFPAESIASLLKKGSWVSSAFSAADLNFSHMEQFLRQQGFETVRDVKSIECDEKDFVFNYADQDGIDDKCLTADFGNWLKYNRDAKTFSILWTMQTHHPYSFHGKETDYVHGNTDLNRYLNALHHDDEAFGSMMESLEKEELVNTTLVIVIGDHGEAFGRHNQYTHASNIYEENLHIPCILINPMLFKGERDSRVAGVTDIPATIASLTGSDIPGDWQGRSLFDTEPKDQTFFFSPFSDFLFGTRKGNWKLIFNATTNAFELYDLSNDPEETTNLADNHPEIVSNEYQRIAAWVRYQDEKMKTWTAK